MKKPTLASVLLGCATVASVVALIVVCILKDNKISDLKGQLGGESSAILEEEQAKKNKEIQELTQQVESLNSEVSEKENTIENLQAKIEDLENQIAETGGSDKSALIQKKKELEANKSVLESNIATLKAQINTLNETIAAKKSTYLVVYIDDSGVARRENVSKNGNVANVPTPTARTGYDVEWSRNGSNITEDTIIVANYTIKTYNITYILGRPHDSFYSLCGAQQYGEDNTISILGISYIMDFSANTVTSVYEPMLENQVVSYDIVNNQFTIDNVTYTINRDFKVVYAVVGDNAVIAKPEFYNLPTTINYGETLVMGFFAHDYVNYVKRDGTIGNEFGRREPYTWVVFGADSVAYDTSYPDETTKTYVQTTNDLLIFVEYQREPS